MDSPKTSAQRKNLKLNIILKLKTNVKIVVSVGPCLLKKIGSGNSHETVLLRFQINMAFSGAKKLTGDPFL